MCSRCLVLNRQDMSNEPFQPPQFFVSPKYQYKHDETNKSGNSCDLLGQCVYKGEDKYLDLRGRTEKTS